jgi:hypothetical protein
MVMQNGRRIRPSPPLSEIRDRAARSLEQLPEPLRRLETGFSYSVKIADALIELSKQVDRRLAEQELERCSFEPDQCGSSHLGQSSHSISTGN